MPWDRINPDSALQITVDVSRVSYVATANALDLLPSPIRGRFRVIAFPKPVADDLDALLRAVLADLARERGLDARWIIPLDGAEYTPLSPFDCPAIDHAGGFFVAFARVAAAIRFASAISASSAISSSRRLTALRITRTERGVSFIWGCCISQ